MRPRAFARLVHPATRLVLAAQLVLGAAGSAAPPAVARPAAADPTPEPAAGASGPARLYFPFLATAGPEIMPGLADLLPPDVNVVLATADAAGEHAPVSSRGAAVFFQEQPVAVIAPPGAYSQTVTLTLQAQPAADTDAAAAAFTLEARTPQGALVAQAERPLRLVVDLRGADLPAGQQWVLAYQDAADPALWHRPEVSVHDAAGLISVETSHFSNWLAGAEPQPWKFTPNLPAAAAFSGAATYRYPIAVPAGRAGLTPNIDVSYSSRALDGLTASADHDQGALGLGWSLGEAEISRRAVYTVVGENGLMPVYPDLFSLALNGQTHALFPANGADTAHDPVVRYYAENGPQLYIERRLDPAAPNQDKLYWLVRTPDGTAYRFGYTAEAEVVQTSLIAAEVGHPGLTDAHPLRWLVDTATDVFGNQLQYDYDTWPKPDGGLTTDGVRPAEIRYNYAALAPDPLTRVGGPYASRLAFLGTDSGRVREIQVFHVDLIRPVRRILFSLDSAAYFGAANCGQASVTNLVTAIQDVGSDGAARLPAVTFEYLGLPHYNNCFPYLYLRQVHNGYGGRVRFTYASDGRQEDLHGEPRVPAFGRAYFVTHVETWDGVMPQPAVTQIEYSRPCYDNGVQLGRLPGAFDCLLHPAGSAPGVAPNLAVGGLVGFETATLTVLNYGGLRSLQRTVTTFSQDPLTLGQAVRVQTLGWDGAAWALRQESETDYTAALIAGGPARAFRVRAARTTTHNGGEPVTVRSENTRFDDFGNVEEQVEYDLAGQPYRRTVSQYAHNTAAGQWITGALVRQRVFAWEGAGWAAEPLSESRSDYNADGDPATAAPDAHGRLTASRQWAGGGDFVDTRYTYDAWGHQATVTTFGGYGSAARYAEADPRITRAEYDAALFALYPVAQTNARGHQVTAVYDTRLGLPVQVTDPNGAATRFAYDPFGRLTAVARPGDTLEIPTTRYVYVDGGAPSRIETYQRTASGCAACERGTLEFYDGLGRTVQTRGAAAGGRQTVVNTTYDALGRAVSTYLPVFEPAGLAFTRPAGWEARPHTLAEYDALGRSVRVIGADGATALAAYRGPRTAVVDAAGRQRLSEADAFGRTVAVFEYQAAGLAAPDFDLPAYAVTRYTYDPRGALTRMEALSATTIITYSVLGQKIGLADPDLGVWTYAYQPSGELVAQTDARGVTTRFTYDALGRLTGRAFSIPAGLDVLDPGPAFHYYDEGGAQAQALGRRTRLVDAAGTTRWQYDARGRVTAEERRLAGGLGVYAFAYAYNAADQLLTLTYPDGEIVTTTLDAAGRPLGLTDGAGTPLVTGADYDAQARLTRLGLGNELTTTYTYYAATEPLQGGRLRRLSVGDALLDLTYAYDPAGNLARLTDVSRLLAGSQVLQFEYDGLERLTRAWTSGSAQGGYAEAYRYDALGRLLEREQAGQTQTYTYADPAHLHAATALGTDDRYTYDANGAMTERVEAGTAYTQTWTADDRLAVMQWVAAGRPYTTTFAYDGDGRRAVRIEADERGAVATVYAAGLYERQLDVTGQDLPRLWYAPAAGGRRSPGLARPAADDYTGPVVRNVQLWVAPVYGWENGHRVPTSSWSCDNKPAYPALGTECGDPPALLTIEECYGEAAPCYAGEMYTQLDGGYTTTVTYGPATVQAALTCTLGHNGWCLDQAVLTLLGTEPLPNETITGIAYSLNGAGIGSHTLNINPRTLTVGDTAATYYFWAESSFGDQSAMQSLPVKVDTTRPALQFSGPLPGAWDLSAAIVITATDLGSGPACLRIASDAWPLDDGSCAAVSASTVFPGGGVHTLNVRAWDRAGQPTTWSGTYAPDLTPPVLAGPAVTACAADSVWQRTCNAPAFTWPAAADAFSGVAGYEVYWGTSAAGAAGVWTAAASYPAGATPEGTHYLRVRAKDQAGNWSGWATLFTFQYDAAPPVLAGPAVTACAADSVWQSTCNAPAFTWPAALDSLSGPAGYEVYWGASAAGAAGLWTAAASYLAGATPEGTRYLRARAKDQAGNWSGWATLFTFRSDATPPTVAIDLEGAAGAAGWYRTSVAVTLTAADALAGPLLTHYRLDGGAWAAYAGPFTVADDGWHTVEYRAQDQAGNWSASVIQPLNIDGTAPDLAGLAAVEASAQNVLEGVWQNRVADPRFTWSGAGDVPTGAPARYRVYWGPDPAGTAPAVETAAAEFDPTGDVPSGVPHYLRLQAGDAAGNWSAWRTVFVFTFENSAPEVLGLWPADGQVLTTTRPTLTAALADPLPGAGLDAPVMTLDQQVITPSLAAGSLTYTPAAPLAPGPHTWLLSVPDRAGNQTLVRRTFVVDAETRVAIAVPADGALLNTAATALVLEGEPGAAVAVTIGGEILTGTLDAAGRWEAAGVLLPAGVSAITAAAVDTAGNRAAAQATITVDVDRDAAGVEMEEAVVNPSLTPAVFKVTARAGGGRAVLGWALAIRAADETLAAQWLGAAAADRQALLWDGRLITGEPAPEGMYTARVVLTTTAGLVTASPVTVFEVRASAPAAPTLDCGPDGALWFSQPPALAHGTAPSGTRVVIYQDGVPQFVAPVFAGQWQQLIAITAGAPVSVSVSARALDAAGNISAPAAACRLGLSQTDPFTLPHAGLSQAVIGLGATIWLTATTRAVGAPLTAEGVRVSVPAELGAPALTLTDPGPEGNTWTGAWQLPAAGLWQAPATVIFAAADTAVPVPNQGAQFVQPYVDLVPPVTRMLWPDDGHRQAEAVLTVHGLAEAFSIVTVRAGGREDAATFSTETSADETGQWQAAITLPDGAFALTAQAVDRAGNQGVATAPITLTVDTAGPVIERPTLTPAFVRPGEAVSITVSLSDATSGLAAAGAVVADLQQGGETASVPLTATAAGYVGVISVGPEAGEGFKAVQIRAVDELGNTSTLSTTGLIIDASPPLLLTPTLAALGPALVVSGTHVIYGPHTAAGLLVTAVVSDDAEARLTAGLERLAFPAVFGADGALEDLAGRRAPGAYTHVYTPTGAVAGTFTLEAVDRAGNTASRTLDVLFDSAPPTVTLSAPAQTGLRFSVRWAGLDEQAGLASYDVQLQTPAGPDWTPWLTGTTAVELDYLAPAAGAHVVRVRAADQVGNLSAWQSITVTVAAVTKYYQFNGQRLVLRQGSAVYYLHGDHLGSAALVTDAAGGVVSQARYLPFGQERLTAGASPSDFAFTGQRREGFGLLDYNGRYYAPQLAQFISADPVAPAVLSTQALNRFAYVLYNPLKFVDPTGYTQKLCGESCENNGGYSGERGNPVNNNMYELTADQYAQLAIFAESSNGSHPDLALYLMAWVAGNSIGQAGNPFEYADKFYYGMRDLLKTFMPFPKPKVFHIFMADAIKAQLDSLTSATRAYIYHRAYTWYSRYAYRGENGYGDEFDKVVTLYSMAKTDRTNGAPDPTGGSTMFNHASYTAYNRTSWPLVGAGGIQSPEQFVAVLTANFEKYKAQVRPDFVYSFYIYPPDSPNVGGLVLVTGNRVCIQGWNGCGAYLP